MPRQLQQQQQNITNYNSNNNKTRQTVTYFRIFESNTGHFLALVLKKVGPRSTREPTYPLEPNNP